VSRISARVVPAYAKLNLSLSVVARRPDGWHDIDSVLVSIDWHDLVGIEMALAAADTVSLRVSGPVADGVPTGDANLTVRAARALATLARRPLEIRLWLSKSVPHGAGLGGGSADAAAVLRTGAAMLAELGIVIGDAALTAAALTIGSDIPALLAGGAQRVRGRGDVLERITTPAMHIAIASTAPSSTAATYAALSSDEIIDDGRSSRLAQSLKAGHGPEDALLGSALEHAACCADPALETALRRARAVTPDATWHLTGSGGAVFALGATRADAERLAASMRAAGFSARACRTIG
jgi:4-diphosphocytidyl-2-C-methyl-D-erythritol kinase